MPETILVATIGGQPQIVTFALDTLLAQGEPITQLYLLHLTPASARWQGSIQKVLAEFEQQHYHGRPCRVHRCPILDGATPLAEIRNEREAEIAGQTIRRLLAQLKVEGHKLHLCVAGGWRYWWPRRPCCSVITKTASGTCTPPKPPKPAPATAR